MKIEPLSNSSIGGKVASSTLRKKMNNKNHKLLEIYSRWKIIHREEKDIETYHGAKRTKRMKTITKVHLEPDETSAEHPRIRVFWIHD